MSCGVGYDVYEGGNTKVSKCSSSSFPLREHVMVTFGNAKLFERAKSHRPGLCARCACGCRRDHDMAPDQMLLRRSSHSLCGQ